MNTSMIRYILGHVLKIEAILLLLPCLTAVYYQEIQGVYYLLTAAICIVLGFLMTLRKPKNNVFYLKEGCVATALSWMFLSVFGCLPFVFSREIPSFTNALFETISGFTTTGASILEDVEALSHCALLWRSFTHWIGGMGVLVFLLAIVPMSGGSNINLMRAESPGPSVGKLVPKMVSSARILYGIYFGLTLLEAVLLVLGGMPLFDSVATSFGTAGTGGFGIKADSFAGYAVHLQWIVTIFMILFGVNFNAYYFILFHQFRKAFGMEEVRAYFIVILASVAFITCNIRSMCTGVFDALTQAAFQVGSIITTTGFATANFDLWPKASQAILVMLMFCGACAGSTGGGIKVSRILILFKSARRNLHNVFHPEEIRTVRIDGERVSEKTIQHVQAYLALYVFIIIVSFLLVSLDPKEFSMTTNFSAVMATFNNIGPGFDAVGPMSNFSAYGDFSKIVMCIDMLLGRLEIYPILTMLAYSTYKKA